MWRDGALFGATPEQAFFVKCDEETNPPDVVEAGQVVIEIGIAPVKPAEFVVFRISQFTAGAAEVSRVAPSTPERGDVHASQGTASRPHDSASTSAARRRIGNFRECTGLDSETTVIEHTSVDANGNPIIRKVPGALKWSNITLKRGVDESQDLSNWRKQVLQEGPDSARVDGFIEMLDYNGHAHQAVQVPPGLAGEVHGRQLRPEEQRRGGGGAPDLPRGAGGRVAAAGRGPAMRTEIAFTLPRGWVDASGEVHREGRMRLATARDEIEPLRDPAVRENEAYLGVLLLARVVTQHRRRSRTSTPEMIEGLFAADFDHLQKLYERLNTDGEAVGAISCPSCGHAFEVDLTEIQDGRLGEP